MTEIPEEQPVTSTTTISQQSNWQVHFGDIIYTPLKGNEPNWFYRFMQRLLLGFRWVKKEK